MGGIVKAMHSVRGWKRMCLATGVVGVLMLGAACTSSAGSDAGSPSSATAAAMQDGGSAGTGSASSAKPDRAAQTSSGSQPGSVTATASEGQRGATSSGSRPGSVTATASEGQRGATSSGSPPGSVTATASEAQRGATSSGSQSSVVGTARPSATQTAASVAAQTTAVPAPGRGDIHKTVSAVPVTTRKPVKLSAKVDFGTGITAHLVSVASINAKAIGPGEVSGPAVSLKIQLANGSSEPVSLDAVTVNVTDSTGAPGLDMHGTETKPFSGVLAAGRTSDGVYVFTVPLEHRNPITVSVSYSAGTPVVQFIGVSK